MAAAARTTPGTHPPARGAGATTAALAALEAQRQRAFASGRRTWARIALALPLSFLPLALLVWTSGAPAPGAADSLLRSLARAAFEALPPAFAAGAAFVTPLVALTGCALAHTRGVRVPRAAYLRDVKRVVYGAACAEHFPGIQYDPDDGMPWRLVDDSGLFAFASEAYASEDRFAGRWGETEVCFAEAVAERTVKRGMIGRRETVWETYFSGIVFVADFNKHFHATVRLVPRGETGTHGAGEERVALEDPRFTAVFETWASDATNARYVLSLSLMERLCALNERHPGLRARFHAGRLLLLLPCRRDLFEPDIDRPAADAAQVATFVADVRACLGVVEALNLDTRIWTKR